MVYVDCQFDSIYTHWRLISGIVYRVNEAGSTLNEGGTSRWARASDCRKKKTAWVPVLIGLWSWQVPYLPTTTSSFPAGQSVSPSTQALSPVSCLLVRTSCFSNEESDRYWWGGRPELERQQTALKELYIACAVAQTSPPKWWGIGTPLINGDKVCRL